MSTSQRQDHWQNVYHTKSEHEVSWFQETPEVSLEMIRSVEVSTGASIIDIGGGSSRLVDCLLDSGFTSISVLDLSEMRWRRHKPDLALVVLMLIGSLQMLQLGNLLEPMIYGTTVLHFIF